MQEKIESLSYPAEHLQFITKAVECFKAWTDVFVSAGLLDEESAVIKQSRGLQAAMVQQLAAQGMCVRTLKKINVEANE